jgi:hypothetical protein
MRGEPQLKPERARLGFAARRQAMVDRRVSLAVRDRAGQKFRLDGFAQPVIDGGRVRTWGRI